MSAVNPLFEMLIPRGPVSLQTKNRDNLQKWKDYVYGRARDAWRGGAPFADVSFRVTLVHLSDDNPVDVDNIIKPIQDALVGVVFASDILVSDVDSHRRYLSDPIVVTSLPPLLQTAVMNGKECVYVRVSLASSLEDYL